MRINHNIAALNTYRQLTINNDQGNKSLEKLSSGMRINRAGDDAAGLAISEKMRGQIRGLTQASRNAQDGISMIQTAEGALNETHSILQRMRELADQAANDTNNDSDRGEIQKEMNQLTSEINRIGNTTEFNTQKLLNGGAQVEAVAVTEKVTPDMGTATGAVGAVTPNVAYKAGTPTAPTNTADSAVTATTDFKTTVTGSKEIHLNGETVALTTTAALDNKGGGGGQTLADIKSALQADIDAVYKGGATLGGVQFTVGDDGSGNLTITSSEKGAAAKVDLTGTAVAAGDIANALGFTAADSETGSDGTATAASFDFSVTTDFAAGDKVTIDGTTLTAGTDFAVGTDEATTATAIVGAYNAKGTGSYTLTDDGAGKITMTQKTASDPAGAVPTIDVAGPTAIPGEFEFSTSKTVAAGGSYSVDGEEILVVDDATKYAAEIAAGTAMLAGANADEQATNLIAAVTNNANLNTKYTAAAGTTTSDVKLTQAAASLTAPTVETSAEAGATGKFEAKLQIGANTGQSFTIDVNDMRSEALEISTTDNTVAKQVSVDGKTYDVAWRSTQEVTNGTDDTKAEYSLDVSNHDNATAAIKVLDEAINTVSAERSKMGAFQNRLEHTINNLGTSSENLTAAESRIRDVDMAKEMMTHTKNNILAQAAQAMLAQANQQPQGVLQLLR